MTTNDEPTVPPEFWDQVIKVPNFGAEPRQPIFPPVADRDRSEPPDLLAALQRSIDSAREARAAREAEPTTEDREGLAGVPSSDLPLHGQLAARDAADTVATPDEDRRARYAQALGLDSAPAPSAPGSGLLHRVMAVADAEQAALRRGGKTLGEILDRSLRDVLDASGMHHVIDETGDGDWELVWERLAELRPRLEAAERALADERATRARVEALIRKDHTPEDAVHADHGGQDVVTYCAGCGTDLDEQECPYLAALDGGPGVAPLHGQATARDTPDTVAGAE